MTQSTNIYLPVNWADGMKINKQHFIAEQQANAWQQSKLATAMLTPFNYGIVLQQQLHKSRQQLVVTSDNQQQVTVRLLSCYAITPGGHVISFDDETTDQNHLLHGIVKGLQAPYDQLVATEASYYVVVSVNPYQRIPAGEPNVEETQLRPPFTLPDYKLHLVPAQEWPALQTSGFHLPVGKIKTQSGKVLADEDYIAPCTVIAANPRLIDLHVSLEEFYSSMETYILQIQQKVIQKKQQNDLASLVMELSDKMSGYMCGEYQRLLQLNLYQAPVHLFQGIAGLARLIKNTIDIYTGTLKDDLLNYFNDWCGISQGELETTATQLSTHRYAHHDIAASVEVAQRFTRMLLQLFSSLAGLDYIGKKREAGIFVKEQLLVPDQEIVVRRRTSFLAD